jgi:hypothetical protein
VKGNRLWALGSFAAIAVIVVLGWVLGLSPKLAEADMAIAQQQTVDQQNAIQEAALVTLREQNDSIGELEKDLEELREHIPESQQVDEFVDSAQLAATSAGVVILRVVAAEGGEYGAAPVGEGQPAPEAGPIEGAPAPTGLYTIAVDVEVKGTPEAVIRFSELMQLGKRIYLVAAFSYSPDSTSGLLNGYLSVMTAAPTPPE